MHVLPSSATSPRGSAVSECRCAKASFINQASRPAVDTPLIVWTGILLIVSFSTLSTCVQEPATGEPMEHFRNTPVEKKQPVRTYERFSQVVSHLLQPNGRLLVVSEWGGRSVKASSPRCSERACRVLRLLLSLLSSWWRQCFGGVCCVPPPPPNPVVFGASRSKCSVLHIDQNVT